MWSGCLFFNLKDKNKSGRKHTQTFEMVFLLSVVSKHLNSKFLNLVYFFCADFFSKFGVLKDGY